jgi:hypothetical protein
MSRGWRGDRRRALGKSQEATLGVVRWNPYISGLDRLEEAPQLECGKEMRIGVRVSRMRMGEDGDGLSQDRHIWAVN